MNLHISTPSAHTDAFHGHLRTLGLAESNRIILRLKTQSPHFRSADLHSREFDELVGDTEQYDQVFIHQFSPMLYRWVAQHRFRKLNWMVWGADLYNLPGHEFDLYEPRTKAFVKSRQTTRDRLYRLKARVVTSLFRDRALKKVDHILTWMNGEFQWARNHLPVVNASHKYFFYQNRFSYESVIREMSGFEPKKNPAPTLLLGNSGTPSNNHLDLADHLVRSGFRGELIVPLTYGSPDYIRELKSALKIPGCSIRYLEAHMPFPEYLRLLAGTDGLIMNTLRPQGYGNIFLMMVLGKKVFLNPKNPSCADLRRMHLEFGLLDELGNLQVRDIGNSVDQQGRILQYFSEDRMKTVYQDLF